MKHKMMNFSLSFLLSNSIFSLVGLSMLIQLNSSMTIGNIIIGMFLGLIAIRFIPTLPKFIRIFIAILLLVVETIFFAISLRFTISKDIPFWILLIITILCFLYFGKQKKLQIKYFTLSLFFLSIILTIFTWIGLIPNIHFQFLNISNSYMILQGVFWYFLMTVLPILLLKKEERNPLAYGLSSLLNLITTLLVFFTLGITLSSYYLFPHFVMLSEIEYFEVIRRIDQFLFFPNLFSGFILLIYTYQIINDF